MNATVKPDALEDIRLYYGEVLQSSGDLKTGACCATESLPRHFRVDGNKSAHYGLFDCKPAAADTAAAGPACC